MLVADRGDVRIAIVTACLATFVANWLPVACCAPPVDEALDPVAEDDPLLDDQRALAEKYERLEDVLLRMAELSAVADPRRAALLKKTIAESRQRMVGIQLNQIAEWIDKGQLSRAVEGQEAVGTDLDALLELLLSEDRGDRLASERARVREYLRQLGLLIKRQKSLRGRTESQDDPQSLAEEQREVGDSTESLADEIRRNEETADQPADSGERSPLVPDSEDEKSTEPGTPADDATPSGSGEEDGGDDAESGRKPSEGSQEPPSGSSPADGDSSGESTPPGDASEHPSRQRLRQARQEMRRAAEELDEARRDEAIERQEEAMRNLERAKAELEEILRQLREEEIQQALELLQSRVVRMLEMQRAVLEATRRLDEAAGEGELTHSQEIQASRLSSQEADIVEEADRALLVLRDDGSAVALPEAMMQVREDLLDLVDRLGRSQIGVFTQSLEEEVIVALEEMLDALEQAIEDAEDRREGATPGGGGAPGDPSLVDYLAELKMIRTLQVRINSRTERYSKLIDGDQAQAGQLREALDELAERQARIYRIAKDLQMGRNQ